MTDRLQERGGIINDETIVAATDLSLASNQAVAQAAVLVRRRGCRLRLLHVFDDSALAAAGSILTPAAWRTSDPIAAAHRRLRELAEDIGRREAIDVQSETRPGQAAEQIAAFAQEAGASLVVVGKHTESLAGAPFLGGTALKAIERIAVPILTASEPVRACYMNAIVAIDFSEAARHAATLAAAWFPDAAITLLHAYSLPLQTRMRLAEPSVDTVDRHRENERHAAERRMAELRASLPPSTTRARTMLRYGHAAAVILDEARKLNADLIVVGRHGGSAIGERLLGSVTRDVLYHADVSVLLVP